jgi:DNA polymerase
VLARGPLNADIMLVGEAPGEQEDSLAVPFAGPVDRWLSYLLESAGTRREEVYTTLVAKCRPPGDRDPMPQEVATCKKWLAQEIEAVRPEVIVSVGKHVTWYLTGIVGSMAGLIEAEGLVYYTQRGSIPVVPIRHPDYLLQLQSEEAQRLLRDTVRRIRSAR